MHLLSNIQLSIQLIGKFYIYPIMTLTATFINHFLNEYKQYYKLF